MIYLSQMLGKPVIDSSDDEIGTINDIAIATGEVFPRVTSLAFLGPDKTPFMLSWRKFVMEFDGERIRLNVPAPQLRFSYLQPDEVLLSRDLLNKQIVDTQGMKVVRVNDLKLSESRNQLRLLGAEVGVRGILRGISPALERGVERFASMVGGELSENLIAWNYMDLLDRDLSQVKLSVTHKRLHELHPADVADIMEQLSASQRAKVFEHLDNEQAAEALSELEDEYQADVIDDLSERRASLVLAEMDPDDAADIVGDLPRDKAERLLRLMGLEDATAIRGLLGYKEKTAGGIMTPEVTTVTDDMTVVQVIEHLREIAEEQESIYYVYVVEGDSRLTGVISLRQLLLASPATTVAELAERELFTANPDDDQEDVAEQMSKYDLLALPVVDERGTLLGIVTVDDALDVLEEESAEDLALATGSEHTGPTDAWWWIARRSVWLVIWAVVALGVAAVTRDSSLDIEVYAPYVMAAVLLMPLVLRTAEDITGRVITELIEQPDEEERPGTWRLLGSFGLVGGVLGGLVGLAVFALGDFVTGSAVVAGPFAVATGLAVLGVCLGGVVSTFVARRRAERDLRVSGTALSTALMSAGAALYLVLGVISAAIANRLLGG